MKIKFILFVYSVTLLFMMPLNAFSLSIDLNDLNSHVKIDTSHEIPGDVYGGPRIGTISWKVEDKEYGYHDWYYYRLQDDSSGDPSQLSKAQPLVEGVYFDSEYKKYSTEPITANNDSDPGNEYLSLNYKPGKIVPSEDGEDSFYPDLFSVKIDYNLIGGNPKTGASYIFKEITITNIKSDPLHLQFFQYSDFDLTQNYIDDKANRYGDDSARFYENLSGDYPMEIVQIGGSDAAFTGDRSTSGVEAALIERLLKDSTSMPIHWGIDIPVELIEPLRNKLLYELADENNAIYDEPSDVSFGFQWDVYLAEENESFTIRSCTIIKDFMVPEPATIFMLGSLLIGLIGFKKKM